MSAVNTLLQSLYCYLTSTDILLPKQRSLLVYLDSAHHQQIKRLFIWMFQQFISACISPRAALIRWHLGLSLENWVSASFQLERRWWTRTLERSSTSTYSCWLRNSPEDSRECAEDLTATYVEWCAWWQRRRWRWWGRRATGWTCRRNGSSSFPHSCPPRDSGGRNALSGQKHGGKKTS